MFKHLTRNLKLGLTALTILTAGGFAFAPMAEAATAAQIAKCNSNPFGTGTSYGTGGCAVTLGLEFSAAKEQYCDKRSNSLKPICRPTADRWIFENPDAPTTPDTVNRRNQFLRGTGTGVRRGTGLVVNSWERDNLNLSTASFNGVALGGDATDGVAFFMGDVNRIGREYAYSGLFSGTDLGGPITTRSGKASWVGRIENVGYGADKDFVLEVDYATRSLDAFVHYYSGAHYRLDATYDSTGHITGEFELSFYRNNDRTDKSSNYRTGNVTGLIGQEGAVGAFISDETSEGAHRTHTSNPTQVTYAGGFVARPAHLVVDEDDITAQAHLDETCEDNPLHEFCFFSNERATRILADCYGTLPSPRPAHCSTATVACVNNPFADDCYRILGGHTFNIAGTNRLDFCNNTDNSRNSLCIGANLNDICSYAPFSPICLDHAGSNSKRTDIKFNACRASVFNDLTCHGVSPELEPSERKPNTDNWLDSFVTESFPDGLPSVADTTMRSQFLQGGETGLDQAAIPRLRETDELYLNADNFGDTLELLTPEVPTDTTDGVAFAFARNSANQNKFYAGILSGTDLGEPITVISETKAVWEGTFQSVWVATKTKFDLEITFGNDKTGSIKAFIERKTSDKFYSIVPHFYLDGTFDSSGLITGKVITARFTNKIPVEGYNYRYTGILRGLIGKEGAVGAFVGGTSTDNGNTITGTSVFSGGFVARESTVDYADWEGAATPLDAIPATGNQFLSGELLDSLTRSTTKLNLRYAEYNGYLLNGDRADGVAFFKRPADSFPALYYAGVLSDTDLGSLIVPLNTRAYWSGSLQVANLNGIQPAVDFVLTVNFDGTADKAGSIVAKALNAAESNGPQPVHLNGKFDYKGVITGTSKMGNSNFGSGELIGLIGQDGAVGTFISTAGVVYSGGFVARPHSVNIKDLRNYATLQTTPSRGLNGGSEFLRASLPNGELDDNSGHFPEGFNFTPTTRTIIGRRDGDTNDGYQYFGAEHDDQDSRYYAGILSTTNLGAPLVTPVDGAPTTAIWEGDVRFIHLRTPDHDTKPTKFYLDFSAGTIGFANDARNGTDTATVGVTPSNTTGVQLTLNGKFGAGDSTLGLGQLGGHMLVSTRPDTQLFPVTGLIGQDGVVGVFVNPSNTSGAGGGFTASPPSE